MFEKHSFQYTNNKKKDFLKSVEVSLAQRGGPRENLWTLFIFVLHSGEYLKISSNYNNKYTFQNEEKATRSVVLLCFAVVKIDTRYHTIRLKMFVIDSPCRSSPWSMKQMAWRSMQTKSSSIREYLDHHVTAYDPRGKMKASYSNTGFYVLGCSVHWSFHIAAIETKTWISTTCFFRYFWWNTKTSEKNPIQKLGTFHSADQLCVCYMNVIIYLRSQICETQIVLKNTFSFISLAFCSETRFNRFK